MADREFIINQQGAVFYTKWLKDTKTGMYIFTPLLLAFYLGVSSLIYGITTKFVLISILPIFLILTGFTWPYFSRKKYFNQLVRKIELTENYLIIETYQWFAANPVIESIPTNKITIFESFDFPYLKEQKVYSLKNTLNDKQQFYIVNAFFDDLSHLPGL